ncbi:MAG: hypothetical protein NVS4B8_20890 [Herpetosiphon sp.]
MIMRVVFYTNPNYLDTALPFIDVLSRQVELHVLIEVAPETRKTGLFDVSRLQLENGLVPAAPILAAAFPESIHHYWSACASVNLVVHTRSKTFHPATWTVSQRARRHIRHLEPDIIHFDDASLRLAIGTASTGPAPTVMSIHDTEAHSGEHSWRNTLRERLLFPHVRHFIVRNHQSAAPFAQKYHLPAGSVDVVRFGTLEIFRSWITPQDPQDTQTILFFGRLSPYKGLDTLYQAAELVAQHVPAVHFVVAGRPNVGYTPPPLPSLHNECTVDLLDRYISNSELADLFQRATLVVCPYIDATQSGVVLTAYAFRKPVVATRVGGLPEYIDDGSTGLLVPPSDPPALAAAITRLLQDRKLLSAMNHNIEQQAGSSLSWERVAGETMQVYNVVRTGKLIPRHA